MALDTGQKSALNVLTSYTFTKEEKTLLMRHGVNQCVYHSITIAKGYDTAHAGTRARPHYTLSSSNRHSRVHEHNRYAPPCVAGGWEVSPSGSHMTMLLGYDTRAC